VAIAGARVKLSKTLREISDLLKTRTLSALTTSSNSNPLAGLLQSVFGFERFRANQLEVCEAAVAGRDLLLVMPTGAGKSLCYQLPALARGGTALVISPLIALMDDQAAKLSALGLCVGRIHSGLDRSVARQACADYLHGGLQFLFIAPERLRVPGFPEMLAKRKLALIAIDEAHCISQWGHDFRPDYRMLGQYLPALRGEGDAAPVLAMTATATPTVQADITAQLSLLKPALFIHGFRRDNLAIEVVELPVPERAGVIARLLANPDRRPAIVYATSRKQAERLAEELSHSPSGGTGSGRIAAAAYHAGLDAETRERVQTAFQAGELEVVVATIAFGMGIDKADIRTVIHAGLPATLEGYYQEIGRAGRDGAMSRTFLMHNYADQRTHDFFLNRDYPPVENLTQVFRALSEEPRPVEELRAALRLGEEEFDKALEKLEIHGGARRDFGGNVTVGGTGWKKTYSVQAQYRAEQFAKVLRYTELNECRMSALVRHFGDVEDAKHPCGVCDVCDPGGAVLRLFRRATAAEIAIAQRIVEELRGVDYKAGVPTDRSSSVGWKATGTLQRNLDLVGRISRDEYEGLLGAMVQSHLIEMEEAEFEKDGQVIRFRKVRLTDDGRRMRPEDSTQLLISDGVVEEFAGRGPAPSRAKSTKLARQKTPSVSVDSKTAVAAEPVPLTAEGEALAARIREWRAAEAKRLKVPAYVVLHERTLLALAEARPKSPNELLVIDGIGPAKVERFGEELLRLCAGK
jgi:ATP-dependent DNA helicase RecQ